MLDTGTSTDLICSSDFAESLGLNIDYVEGNFNGESEKFGKALIDSLEIGGLTAYNIPAFIPKSAVPNICKEEKDTEVRAVLKKASRIFLNPIFGLRLMYRIGYIEFDFKENKVLFPTAGELKGDRYKNVSLESRLLGFNNDLYFRLLINKQATTLFLDTGANSFINLEPRFYNQYKTDFSIDKYSEDEHTLIFSKLYKRGKVPIIKLKTLSFEDGKTFKPLVSSYSENEICVCTAPLNNLRPYVDGTAGVLFLRSLGSRVLLDLNDMKIKVFDD